jgi:hypothetical protein
MEAAPQQTGPPGHVLPRGSWLPSAHDGARPPGLGARARSRPDRLDAELQHEDLLDRHGDSLYALAFTLVCDEAAATRAMTLGMIDLAHSVKRVPDKDVRRSLARNVYRRSKELAGETSSRTSHLPPAMVWLGQLARLQRACLALCVFGGHSYREAADLLGVPPKTVAELLTTGLREVGRLTVPTTTAHVVSSTH